MRRRCNQGRILVNTPEPGRVSPETLAVFGAQRTAIIRAVIARAMEGDDGANQYGSQTEQFLTVGLDFTTQALEVTMQLHNLEMLDIQLRWANERLPHDGVQPDHLLKRYEILAQVVETALPAPHAQAVNQFVQWMIARQRELIQAKNT